MGAFELSYERYRLLEIAEIIVGGTPKTTVSDYWDGDIPWASIKDLNVVGRYIKKTEKSITVEGLSNSSTHLLKRDDIIISARGTVGELAMVYNPVAFNQSCFGIRAKNKVLPTYLYYSLKKSVGEIKQQSHGSVFDTFSSDSLSKMELCIPSLKIQEACSTILSSIDDQIAIIHSVNDNLGGANLAS